jgi:hypothetical protein
LKGYQVQTSFIFQNGAKGELALVDGNLLFALTDVPGLPGELRYFAAQWENEGGLHLIPFQEAPGKITSAGCG